MTPSATTKTRTKIGTPHTDRLAELERAVGEARARQREAEVAANTARGDVAEAYDALVEATSGGDETAIEQARAQRARADGQLDEATLGIDAAERRLRRAVQEHQAYKAEYAAELIAELEPEAQEVATALAHHATCLVDVHGRWGQLASRVDDYLVAHPGVTPRLDGAPAQHGFEAAVREARQALQAQPEPPPPLPRWTGRRHHEDEDRRTQLGKLTRKRRRSQQDNDRIAQLRRELGMPPDGSIGSSLPLEAA